MINMGMRYEREEGNGSQNKGYAFKVRRFIGDGKKDSTPLANILKKIITDIPISLDIF